MSNKITKKKLNSIVKDYLPEFVKSEEEYQTFIAFMEAFYEYLETSSGALGSIRNLRSLQDVDRTLDEFVDHWHNTLAENLPSSIVSDKRLLLKHMRDVYLAKGTEKSYKLLFRVLFNDDIEMRYPGENILYASGGEWREFIELTLNEANGSFFGLEYTPITGQTSNATGVIERIEKITRDGEKIWRIFYSIESKDGEFEEGEEILFSNGNTGVIKNVKENIGEYSTNQSLISTEGATLHDGFYYQKYSYVVVSGETAYDDIVNDPQLLDSLGIGIWSWRDIVRRILHPAGTILFSEFRTSSVVRGGRMNASQLVRLVLEISTEKDKENIIESWDYETHIEEFLDYQFVYEDPTRFDTYGLIDESIDESIDFGQLLASKSQTKLKDVDIDIDVDKYYFIKTRTHKDLSKYLGIDNRFHLDFEKHVVNKADISSERKISFGIRSERRIVNNVTEQNDYGKIENHVTETIDYKTLDEKIDKQEDFGILYIPPDIEISSNSNYSISVETNQNITNYSDYSDFNFIPFNEKKNTYKISAYKKLPVNHRSIYDNLVDENDYPVFTGNRYGIYWDDDGNEIHDESTMETFVENFPSILINRDSYIYKYINNIEDYMLIERDKKDEDDYGLIDESIDESIDYEDIAKDWNKIATIG